jgi:hypothetical protein
LGRVRGPGLLPGAAARVAGESYRAIAPTSGVASYEATIRVFALTNDPDRSFFDWSRTLEIAEDADLDVVERIIDVMEKQTDAVRDHFAKTSP